MLFERDTIKKACLVNSQVTTARGAGALVVTPAIFALYLGG